MRTSPACCFLLAIAASGATTRPIAETDLYAFHWLADPRIAPDGSQVVYTLVNVTAKHDGYETTLWTVSTSGGPPRQLTAGPHDSSARWSPDGKRLAFLRSTEKDGKPDPAQIYVLPMNGGEARAWTDLPKGAGAPVWSPDGKRIAFTSAALPSDSGKDEAKSDVLIINRAVYRNNGQGYYDFERRAHIWTVEEHQKAEQLTSGRFAEEDPVWSRDGGLVYFLSVSEMEPYYAPPYTDLYVVPSKGGDVTKVAHMDGDAASLALDFSGSRMAFVAELPGAPIRSYSQPDLFVTALQPGSKPRNVTEGYDYDINASIGGDQSPPRGGSPSKPLWSVDGRYVFVRATEEGRANLKRIDMETGKVEPLTQGDQDIYAYSATPDASKFAMAISTPVSIGDLFVLDTATGKKKQLSNVNEELFSKLRITAPETIWYKSFDGRRIQAWVQRPPDFDPSKKYPLILDIHGGPHAAYGYTFDHEFQWMAAKGYIVLYPNPRGSTSYGQDFGNIIQFHYPGDDYKDLMAGVDELIARGWVDPKRLAVTGGSGGGLLTNWVVGHTDRFAAAASQRSIADWRDFWYVADFAQFRNHWFRAAPWQDEADFKARSPITYVDKITTPLMLIEGGADLRTPSGAGGEQMFRALKYRKIPTVMVQFPGETHELSRSGKPQHRVERLQHIVAWFDKWVMGTDIKAYDVQ
jgi:dipeptidyl aminopeptidase/acylaminoacyl peptidase